MLKLNLGCGTDLRPGWENVDIMPLIGIDRVCDLNEPWPWEDGSVEQVFASDVFEHLRDKMHSMGEMWRVCCHGAICEVETPNMVYNPAAWSDPTHRTCWHPENMEYFRPGHAWYYYSPATFITIEMEHTAFRLYWKLLAYKEHDPEMAAKHIGYEEWRASWQGPLGFADGRDILPIQTAHFPPGELLRRAPTSEAAAKLRRDPHE
ncbi:MAG TPA: hypothetical protein VNA25_30220 [Phycisphaerae bacterium]|nr:hypothetical protein [Phycisphaerae bacterium]